AAAAAERPGGRGDLDGFAEVRGYARRSLLPRVAVGVLGQRLARGGGIRLHRAPYGAPRSPAAGSGVAAVRQARVGCGCEERGPKRSYRGRRQQWRAGRVVDTLSAAAAETSGEGG
ncbi:unnamed protein product, partial [Ectocarpus sp. 4 AP-2014]